MRLYFMRHAESEANRKNLLAGQLDFPLSEEGQRQSREVADAFLRDRPIDAIISSPLLRARATALPFCEALGLRLELDEALLEQDMGVFSGSSYPEAEADPRYELDKSRRWDWVPPGGESYEMIARRLRPFFERLDGRRPSPENPAANPEHLLVITHAVTLRIIEAYLLASLPRYPTALARNGEILETDYRGLGIPHELERHYWGKDSEGRA